MTDPVVSRALARFAAKCRFEPDTGCVIWTGGTTSGQGCNTRYGAFWFEGRRWFAHRWSCLFIHGLDPGLDTVGHCCPHTFDGQPNSLCVQHVKPQTMAENVGERNTRVAAMRRLAQQDANIRLHWKLVQLGYEPAPAHNPMVPIGQPRFGPPEWLQPFLDENWLDDWMESNHGVLLPTPSVGAMCNQLQSEARHECFDHPLHAVC